jgi:hypothetical protein
MCQDSERSRCPATVLCATVSKELRTCGHRKGPFRFRTASTALVSLNNIHHLTLALSILALQKLIFLRRHLRHRSDAVQALPRHVCLKRLSPTYSRMLDCGVVRRVIRRCYSPHPSLVQDEINNLVMNASGSVLTVRRSGTLNMDDEQGKLT